MKNVANYWKQEEGYDTYFDDDGFYAYSYSDGEMFIAHCLIEKGKSYSFFKKMQDHAKELGATCLTGNLDLNEHNKDAFNRKVMVHLGNGYKVIAITNNRITVLKQLYKEDSR